MPIFTREDKLAINKALTEAEALRKEIARAKLAGIDVTEHEKRLSGAEDRLRKIKQAYFPNG